MKDPIYQRRLLGLTFYQEEQQFQVTITIVVFGNLLVQLFAANGLLCFATGYCIATLSPKIQGKTTEIWLGSPSIPHPTVRIERLVCFSNVKHI